MISLARISCHPVKALPGHVRRDQDMTAYLDVPGCDGDGS